MKRSRRARKRKTIAACLESEETKDEPKTMISAPDETMFP